MPTESSKPTRARRIRRGVVIGLRVTALVVLGVLLILGTLLALPNVRRAGLERGLAALDEALPGDLSADVAWPALGRIEVRRLRWTIDDASVARARRMDLELRLGALIDRDAVVREFEVEAAWADVDAISQAMASKDSVPEASTSTGRAGPIEVPWLRPGSIDGLPSFALETLSLRDVTIASAETTLEVHDVSVRIDVRPGRSELAWIGVDVGTPAYGRLRGGVALAQGDSLRAQFDVWNWTPPDEEVEPLDVREGLEVVAPRDLLLRVLAGNVDVVPLSLHGVLLDGSPVALRLAAECRPDGAVRAGVDLALQAAPTWIEAFLAEADSNTADAVDRVLREWPVTGDAVRLTADVDARLRGGTVSDAHAGAALRIPDLADVDLHGLTWDGGRAVAVDSVAIRAPGVYVHATGNTDGSAVEADARADVRVSELARRLDERFGEGPWNDYPVVVHFRAKARGDLPLPDFELEAEGGSEAHPRALKLRASHQTERLVLAVDADFPGLLPLLPDSLRQLVESTTIARAGFDLDAAYDLADSSAVADLVLEVAGPDARLDFAGNFTGSPRGQLTARIEQLQAAWGGLDLGASRPIEITAVPADSTLDVSGLELTGSLGEVFVDGTVDPRRAKANARIDLDLLGLRQVLPDSLAAPLEASTLRSVQLAFDGTYDLPRRTGDATLRLDATADEGDAQVELVAGAELPERVSLQVDTLRVRWKDQTLRSASPLVADADLAASTIDLQGLDFRSSFGRLSGQARADSSSADGRIDLEVGIPRSQLVEWLPELEDTLPAADSLRTRIGITLGGTARAPRANVEGEVTLTDVDGRDLGLRLVADYGDERRVDVEADVEYGETTWFHLSGRAPFDVGLDPPEARLRTEDPLDLEVRTPVLDLGKVAEVTRSPIDLAGDLKVTFRADGAFDALELSGEVVSDRARADLPDGSWIETATSVQLSGSLRAPRVDGAVTVSSGLVLLPEVPPSRLPTQGEALLWDTAPLDSAATSTPRSVTPLDTLTLPIPDVAMRLKVPGGLRIRGHGLDVELRGELQVEVEDGVPGVGGELEAWRGRLDLLGRRFRVETGRVMFDPDQVEPDPELDIRLATTLSGTRYTVDVTGSASAPRIELGSDPMMPEGDIVSALLFGRPLDELDEGQSQLLAQRTQDIAAAYGAQVLSRRIGQRLGVDLVSIEPGTDGGAASLVLGQYLSPDVIVQYEQVLEEGAASLVRLEYTITRALRLETTASQGEHSGIEIQWQKDY